MRNIAETGTNRPYVSRKDSLCDTLPNHPCVTMPDYRYPANTYTRGYHASAGGALLKGGTPNGGTPNGNQAIPTAQINSLAALKMGSYEMDWARRSFDGSSQANLVGVSESFLHPYGNEKQWSDDRRFVNSSGVNSLGVNSPVVNPPVVYHLSGEGNTMEGRRVGASARGEQPSGRSVSELAHHSQRVQKVKESHAGCFPRGMEKIYTGDHHGEGTRQMHGRINGRMHGRVKTPPPAGMEYAKGAPLINANFMDSGERSIRGEVLHSWWGQRGVRSPSSEASNCCTLPNVRYNNVGSSPRGMMGVVLVPVNRETRNGFTKWDQSGKEVDAGLVHKWSSGRFSKTSEYSYKDIDTVMYGGMDQGRCYPDDASVESLPRYSFPWGSNEGFLHAKDSNHCAVLEVGGRHYESGGQRYDQNAVRRLSGEGLQRGVMTSWDEGGYIDGLESLESIPPGEASVRSWGKHTDGVTALGNKEGACEEDASRLTQCTYNKSDFTEWVSHNRLVKNIISSHKEDGHVERHGLYSLLFDAYGHNKEAFRGYLKGEQDTSMGELIGRVVHEMRKDAEKGAYKDAYKDADKDKKKGGKKSNTIVEKIIFLKFLFNQYAHTDYPNFISFKCFRTMFKVHKNVFASEKIILFMFNCLDRCRRYYVSESDFLIGMLACSPEMENDITKDTGKLRHQLIFRAYDLDRDGYWSKEEMFVFLYHLYELSKNSKHMTLKGNKKKMKKFVAVQRDKLMRKCEKVSYDNFYHLVLDRKIEGTQNLLRSNCDVASVVKRYFLYTYGGGSRLTRSVDTDYIAKSASVQLDGPHEGEKCEQGEGSPKPSEGGSQDEEGLKGGGQKGGSQKGGDQKGDGQNGEGQNGEGQDQESQYQESLYPVEGTQLKGGNAQQCSSAELSGESTTGDPNSEDLPHIRATSIKGGHHPEERYTKEVVQKRSADATNGSKKTQEEKSEEKSGEQPEEQPEEEAEEQPEEQPQSDGEAAEEPPCGHSNETPRGSDLNCAEECGVSNDVANDVVAGREENAQLSSPSGVRPDRDSSTYSIPHFGGGHEEERANKENRIHEETRTHEENRTHEEQRASRISPERSWSSCVEKMKEIVKAYREKYLTDKTRLFGLNQDVAFKIFSTFYKVSYKRKREKYSRQFYNLCTAACTYNDIILLCDEAAKVFKGEDTIEYVDLPCKVFGDLHGNIFDLLDFFNMYNWPLHGETNEWLTMEEIAITDGTSLSLRKSKEKETLPYMHGHDNNVKYVFLGNYINRGKHSLEVICLLLSLKILFPKHIYLLRGNHEERLFNYVHGFYADIEKKVEKNIKTAGLIRYQGEVIQAHAYELFNRINDVLEFLPLSVLVGGNILCVHAGIGDSLHNVEDFANVHKPIVVPQFVDRRRNNTYERVQKIIIDTLWSDPINYEDEEDMFLLEKLKEGEDIIPSSRGKITLKFGQMRLSSFLKRNKLKMVIRGHECVQEGYRYSYSRRLLTLFSATNYCDRHGNDAANAFIVKRGKSIVIFNQILKCPRGGQLEGTDHGEERVERTTGPRQPLQPLQPLEPLQPLQPLEPQESQEPFQPLEPQESFQPLEPPHKVNRNGPPHGPFPREQAVPYPPESLHWGDFPHEVGQLQHDAPSMSAHGIMSSARSPSEVSPHEVQNWRSGGPCSRVDQIRDASADRMGSQPKIAMSKVAYSVRTLGGEEVEEEEENEEEKETEELPCRRMDEEVTPLDSNEKEFTSDGDAVEKTSCNSAERRDDVESNLILRDSHPIVKRKLRDTRSNEDMNWGVAVHLEKREGVPSRFACSGAAGGRKDGADSGRKDGPDDGRNDDRDGGHFLSDDHSNEDARGDNFEGGPLRKSTSTNGTFSSEEGLHGGSSHGSSERNYNGVMFSSKLSHFKGEGLKKGGLEHIEMEKAQNRPERKSHLKGDSHWKGEYLYEDYQHCLGNLSHGDTLKNPPCDEPASSDELPCSGETKQDSRVNTNAIIEKFFQNGGRDHGTAEHNYINHLEDKEMERGGDLNHFQYAKLTPLLKRTDDVNVGKGDEGGEWGQNGSCGNLMDELMSKPMDYMMMPPDLGLANRPKFRRDTHSNQQKKEHGSATLRSLRSLRSENNTNESLSKLQMQCLPPDPKPQTKISLQKIIDKLEEDA